MRTNALMLRLLSHSAKIRDAVYNGNITKMNPPLLNLNNSHKQCLNLFI